MEGKTILKEYAHSGANTGYTYTILHIAEYPHSEIQHISLSFEQWTSCRTNIAYFLVVSHRDISRLFMVLDSPLTFNEQITSSSGKAF